MEDNKRYHFKVDETAKAVTIREGKALEEKPKREESVRGIIDTPYRYLSKRPDINLKEAHLMVDRQSKSILLRANTRNPWGTDKAEGCISPHPDIELFKINEDHQWNHKALSTLIRMNRTMFSTRKEATELANKFRDLEVMAKTELKNMDDERGSFEIKSSKAIQKINIPESFDMRAVLHIGGEAHPFKVDVIINPADYGVQLISNEMKEAAEAEAERFINEVVKDVEKDFSDLLIYEQ